MGNPRSAANAWGGIKKKSMRYSLQVIGSPLPSEMPQAKQLIAAKHTIPLHDNTQIRIKS